METLEYFLARLRRDADANVRNAKLNPLPVAAGLGFDLFIRQNDDAAFVGELDRVVD